MMDNLIKGTQGLTLKMHTCQNEMSWPIPVAFELAPLLGPPTHQRHRFYLAIRLGPDLDLLASNPTTIQCSAQSG